ncbi:MAG: hypothetical protein ACT4QB_00875 [Gammaproteobacteria bacterium]
MEIRRALGATAFLVGYLVAFPVHAGFHFVQFDEVMAGANGNPAIQFIELTMLENEENCQQSGEADPAGPFGCVDASASPDFSAARLFFFDAAGTPLGVPEGFGFPHNTPIGGAGRSILIGTQAFADLPTPPTPEPDFIMPPMVAANSGKVCYKNDPSAFDFVTQCLSYGTFSGDTEGFGSPAPALPITGAVSLRRVDSTANNATDFALSTPAPCANTGACATPPPPPPPPPPPVTPPTGFPPVSTCRARTCGVLLTCQDSSTACTSYVDLTVRASAVRLGRDPSMLAKARRRIRFAFGVVNVPPDRTDTFKLRLTKNGRKIVKKKNVKRLKGRLEVRNISGAIVSNTPITIRLITRRPR